MAISNNIGENSAQIEKSSLDAQDQVSMFQGPIFQTFAKIENLTYQIENLENKTQQITDNLFGCIPTTTGQDKLEIDIHALTPENLGTVELINHHIFYIEELLKKMSIQIDRFTSGF